MVEVPATAFCLPHKMGLQRDYCSSFARHAPHASGASTCVGGPGPRKGARASEQRSSKAT